MHPITDDVESHEGIKRAIVLNGIDDWMISRQEGCSVSEC